MPRILPTELVAQDGKSILHLPDALDQHSAGTVILYCRVSELAQVHNGSLKKQQDWEQLAVQAEGGRICNTVAGRERGKLSGRRRLLLRAIKEAQHHDAILVARDLSRFVRAEDFNRRTNWHANPTSKEIEQLLELAAGVQLATRIHPDCSPAQIHYQATVSGMNGARPGKKSAIEDDPKVAVEILEEREFAGWSLSKIAETHGFTKRQVQVFTDKWKKFQRPTYEYRRSPEYQTFMRQRRDRAVAEWQLR